MKLEIQKFGGRGASSSTKKLNPTKTNIHNKSVDNMIAKYGDLIDEVDYEGRDYESGEGYWVYLREGYEARSTDSNTIHEASIKDVLVDLKYIREQQKRKR